jgi:hypothetical protein
VVVPSTAAVLVGDSRCRRGKRRQRRPGVGWPVHAGWPGVEGGADSLRGFGGGSQVARLDTCQMYGIDGRVVGVMWWAATLRGLMVMVGWVTGDSA